MVVMYTDVFNVYMYNGVYEKGCRARRCHAIIHPQYICMQIRSFTENVRVKERVCSCIRYLFGMTTT